ncbi:MAG: 2-oxo acid dehydrogenase subunit E2 [Cyclobacteriaceae bacterium]|nr:2-oxo acid dehydrogenase subunit E2 [Cyclobacteriaceae bacterium]
MASVELLMPKMGESIMEATVLTWLKNEGDTIEQDESILEVATDKVDTEVPSTHEGVLTQILAQDGDVVPVGAPIAIITTNGEDAPNTSAPSKETVSTTTTQPVVAEATATITTTLEKPASGRFYSPLVMNIAREEAIDMAELERVPGTGKEGRVTKKDILAYISTRANGNGAVVAPSTQAPVVASPATPTPAPKPQPVSVSAGDEIIEMDRMRKMIASRMIDSKRISPHVTSFVESDMTGIVNWRNRVKKEFEAREGEKMTFTPIIMEAVVKAIKDFPMVNVSVDGDNIIKKRNINIGLAVALPSGNLIVPVVHNADQYNLAGLAKKVNDLARRARENKLTPGDLDGGTYTISNVGSFGNVMGTPIIMQPQVGIMALGAIIKKPAVVETAEGDMIAIRHKMFLSHSYDHRVVDGALGGKMVRRVADYLENFDVNQSV